MQTAIFFKKAQPTAILALVIAAIVGIIYAMCAFYAPFAKNQEAQSIAQYKNFTHIGDSLNNKLIKCAGSSNYDVIPAYVLIGGSIVTQDGIISHKDGSTTAAEASYFPKAKKVVVTSGGKMVCSFSVSKELIAINAEN